VKYRFGITIMVCLFSCLGHVSLAQDLKERIPARGELGDYRMTEEPAIYDRDTLWEYINGGAVGYLAYGFKRMVTFTTAHQESGLEIVVDIYDMGKPVHAYGIYSVERSPDGVEVEWGCDGFRSGTALYFWQDRFYVKIMALDIAPETDKLLSKLADTISRKLPAAKGPPKQLSVFPEEGMVKNSDRYIKTDVLGQDYLQNGFRMEYDQKGKQYTIFVIEGTTPEETALNLNKYRAYLDGASELSAELIGLGEQAFMGNDSFYGTVVFSRKNHFIIGVLGLPGRQAAGNIIKIILGKLEEIKQ